MKTLTPLVAFVAALAASIAAAAAVESPVRASAFRLEAVAHVDPGGGTSGDVFGHAGHAYLSSHRGSTCPAHGVRVYSLANVRRPQLVSTFANAAADPAVEGSWTEKTIVQRVRTAQFAGALAVTSFQSCFAGGFQGFGVYDVSDPARPRKLALVRTEPRGSHEIWLQQRADRVYVYTAIVGSELRSSPDYNPQTRTATIPGDPDFRIYDVSNPAQPRKVGEWGAWKELGIHPTAGRGAARQNIVHSVIGNRAGTRAFLSYWDLGTVILDVSDPSRPRYLGRTTFGPRQAEGDAHSAALAKNEKILIETHETARGTPTIFDISNPRRPRRLAEFRLPPAIAARVPDNSFVSGVHDPKVLGNRAYFSWYRQGVVVADITKPSKPRFLTQFVPPNSPMVWGVYATSGYVLASDMNSGLWVLRLQNRR